MLTQNRLRELVHYNMLTGVMLRKKYSIKRGAYLTQINSCDDRGYLVVRLDGTLYRVHRLAMLYVYGTFFDVIDHRNGVLGDNRFTNLRVCSQQQNMQNRGIPVSNTSGYKGVGWSTTRKKFRAYCSNKHLGYFDTPSEASEAYVKYARQLHGEFYRGVEYA